MGTQTFQLNYINTIKTMKMVELHTLYIWNSTMFWRDKICKEEPKIMEKDGWIESSSSKMEMGENE